jgi:hypothetical protein
MIPSMERKRKARRERRAFCWVVGRSVGPVHHRWARAAAELLSHHQSQARAAGGAEGAHEKPVRIAQVVIAASTPS